MNWQAHAAKNIAMWKFSNVAAHAGCRQRLKRSGSVEGVPDGAGVGELEEAKLGKSRNKSGSG